MDVAQQFKTGATFLKRASIVKHSSIVFGIKLVVKRVENLPLTVERTTLNYNCNMAKQTSVIYLFFFERRQYVLFLQFRKARNLCRAVPNFNQT